MVWTGSKAIVWGGIDYMSGAVNDGASYDPGLNSWTTLSTTGAPPQSHSHIAVWDTVQNKMLVWGGKDSSDQAIRSGGQYDLATDSWSLMSQGTYPSRRYGQSTVWDETNSKLIVWGGYVNASQTATTSSGYIYNPILMWKPIVCYLL